MMRVARRGEAKTAPVEALRIVLLVAHMAAVPRAADALVTD
jgi:hypothetical protein